MMRTLLSLLTLAVLICYIDCRSVRGEQPSQHPDPPVEEGSERIDETNLSYDKYLREVVMTLEEDPEFRKKLEASNVSDIKDGSVAKHIELVNHQVRTKLDEIKRKEIRRLQELRRVQLKAMNGTGVLHFIAYHGGVGNIDLPSHIDVVNPHSFEMKDLERLIKQTTNDLEILDDRRKKEFKEYEMEKNFENKEKLKIMPDEERKKEEQHVEEMKKKHADHPKIHHPGSKDQFEEVWEKKDHLEDQNFNPRSFFKLHDLGGDGFWGIEEVEAVLQTELDKVYDGRNEEDDPAERFEEMNRMREHIFTEMDKNKDSMISEVEFLDFTGAQGEKNEFNQDPGWKTIDEDNDIYTDDEYQRFLEEHHAQPGVVNMPPQPYDPNVPQMQIPQGQLPPGGPGGAANLQYMSQQEQQQHLQQQEYVQHQQVLQHQQQQFQNQHATQQQLEQQHAQMQQQIQMQQQQQQQQLNAQMGQPIVQQQRQQPSQGQQQQPGLGLGQQPGKVQQQPGQGQQQPVHVQQPVAVQQQPGQGQVQPGQGQQQTGQGVQQPAQGQQQGSQGLQGTQGHTGGIQVPASQDQPKV